MTDSSKPRPDGVLPERGDPESLRSEVERRRIQEALGPLRASFRESLTVKHGRLLSIWKAFCSGGSREVLKEAIVLAHRLGGSAGTYGFDEIGTLSKELERELKALWENRERSDAGNPDPPQRCVEKILGLIHARTQEFTPTPMPKILLIDDDKEIVDIYKTILVTAGYEVLAAYSGDEGWKKLLDSPPDLVVLDCMMEEFTTGFDLAHDIRLKFPRLPVIMLTSVREQMNKDWSFGPGDRGWLPIHCFLEKPVRPEAFLDEVRKLLSGTKG